MAVCQTGGGAASVLTLLTVDELSTPGRGLNRFWISESQRRNALCPKDCLTGLFCYPIIYRVFSNMTVAILLSRSCKSVLLSNILLSRAILLVYRLLSRTVLLVYRLLNRTVLLSYRIFLSMTLVILLSQSLASLLSYRVLSRTVPLSYRFWSRPVLVSYRVFSSMTVVILLSRS